jgi:hypothetical protein
MGARQVVLLTSPRSSHPRPLLFRQQSAPLNPLAATLMNLPASVANKRLTPGLNPLDATLTRNTGWGPPDLSRRFDIKTFRRSDAPTKLPDVYQQFPFWFTPSPEGNSPAALLWHSHSWLWAFVSTTPRLVNSASHPTATALSSFLHYSPNHAPLPHPRSDTRL